MAGSDFSLAEHEIYGSSRLGSKNYYPDQVGISNTVSGQSDTTMLWSPQPWYSLEYQDLIRADSTDVNGNELKTGNYARHIIGQKQYELTDHLGDVLATISDKRANDSLAGPHTTGAIDTVSSWKPVVVSATDYYPFGMQMPGRSIADESTHCFYTSYTETVPYFTSITDTFVVSPPPYNAIGGAIVYPTGSNLYVDTRVATMDGVAIHVDGLYVGVPQTIYLNVAVCTTYYSIIVTSGSTGGTYIMTPAMGPLTFPITFTPGSDTACISIIGGIGVLQLYSITLPRVDSFILRDAVTLVCNEDQYHYGFNGKTKDNEWAGVGNHIDYGARGYDSRIARFNSVDPLTKKFPMLTPYQFASNSPIQNIDLDGLEGYQYLEIVKKTDGTTQIHRVVELDVHVATSTTDLNQYAPNDKPIIESNYNQEYPTVFKDASGNTVEFRFNVTTFDADQISPADYSKKMLRDPNNLDRGMKNGATVGIQKGMVLERGKLPGVEGSTTDNKSTISKSANNPSHTQGHETGHILLSYESGINPGATAKNDQENVKQHAKAGGIFLYRTVDQSGNTIIPVQPLNQQNVDAILKVLPEKPAIHK